MLFFIICTKKVVAPGNLVLSFLRALSDAQFFQMGITGGGHLFFRSPFSEQTHYYISSKFGRRFTFSRITEKWGENPSLELQFLLSVKFVVRGVKGAIHLLEIVINWSRIIDPVRKPRL